MKSAGDSVIGFDMYSLDSGRISITRSVKRRCWRRGLRKRIFRRPGTDFTKLPHVTAYFGYFFVKHYQSMNQERNHRGSDLYDEGYYIESTTLGNLLTCDQDLIRTARLSARNDGDPIYRPTNNTHRLADFPGPRLIPGRIGISVYEQQIELRLGR